jgi:hypothetical protein
MSKYLTESGWKAVVLKFKVADNGLQKALAGYEKLPADRHKERLEALASVDALGGKLKTLLAEGIKTAKAHKAKPEVEKNLDAAIDYLTQVLEASKAERKQLDAQLTKAASEAAKATAKTAAAQPAMIDRLAAAAETVSGAPGNRLRKVMAIAKKAGGSWKSLWYYNSHAVFQFVKYDAKPSTREELIKAGGGKLPFKGDTWVVLPFVKKLDMHCPQGCPDKNLVTFLKSLDDDIVTSLDPMHNAQLTEAGTIFGETVNEFIQHVGKLAGNNNHLYSAY